jgi:hypothetical protein
VEAAIVITGWELVKEKGGREVSARTEGSLIKRGGRESQLVVCGRRSRRWRSEGGNCRRRRRVERGGVQALSGGNRNRNLYIRYSSFSSGLTSGLLL